MIRNAEVAKLKSKTHQVGNEVRGMDTPINEDSPVNVRVVCW
jgi:hypothetical protein